MLDKLEKQEDRTGYSRLNLGPHAREPRISIEEAQAGAWGVLDESIDEVHATHVLERVRHTHPTNKDGLVAIMEEAYRVLKPGGLLVVTAYHPENRVAMSDPTVTRSITKETFRYFHPDDPLAWHRHARFILEHYETVDRSSGPLVRVAEKVRVRKLRIVEQAARAMERAFHVQAVDELPFMHPVVGKPLTVVYHLRKAKPRSRRGRLAHEVAE